MVVAVGTSGEPSQLRRLAGEVIRIHRVRAGLTQKDAAERLLISESLMGAVERAERIPSLELLAGADRVFVAGGALKGCIELVDEEKYPAKFLDWARLERQAVLMRMTPPYVGFIIEESILSRTLGGAEVLKEQLLQLLECMEGMNHLTVQVMPSEQHMHAALNGPMQLMCTAEGRNLVLAESQGGGRLISRPEQVGDMFDLFGILRARALDPWKSAEFIETKARQL
ncbi:helix-turn-helix domain-containing protein [Streptomyces sanglieri]|uniref:helix-turn-helix domain-containing protein n=1 Tax=Streptomyces sanglieri TaxID=193460 RepID=UPI003524832D